MSRDRATIAITKKAVNTNEKKEKGKERKKSALLRASPILDGTAAAGQSSRLQIVATSQVRYRSGSWRSSLLRYDQHGNLEHTDGPQRDMPAPGP
jgi:hypothetical protein